MVHCIEIVNSLSGLGRYITAERNMTRSQNRHTHHGCYIYFSYNSLPVKKRKKKKKKDAIL